MHRSVIGQIERTSLRPEEAGRVFGREVFVVARHGDGSRTLTSHGEIDDSAGGVARDVIVSLDRDRFPTDAAVRIAVGGAFAGSGWFRFGDGFAECETFTAGEGRLSQRMETHGRVKGFGTHSLANDAWFMGLYDVARGPGVQEFPDALLASPHHFGASGPILFRMGGRVRLLGKERLAVRAGSFDAWHFQFEDTGALGGYPPYDVWTTADGEFTLLLGRLQAPTMRQFELVSLETLA